jgi:hypothetical protein
MEELANTGKNVAWLSETRNRPGRVSGSSIIMVMDKIQYPPIRFSPSREGWVKDPWRLGLLIPIVKHLVVGIPFCKSNHTFYGHPWPVGEGSCLVVFTLRNAWQQGITPAECWASPLVGTNFSTRANSDN